MPEPSTVAASTQRPRALASDNCSAGASTRALYRSHRLRHHNQTHSFTRGIVAGPVQRASEWLRGCLRALTERRRFVALLDAVEDQVVLSDEDGHLRFANRAAGDAIRTVSGHDWHSLSASAPWSSGCPRRCGSTSRSRSRPSGATRHPVTRELEIPQPTGGTRWTEQKISPVFDDGGRLIGQIIGRPRHRRAPARAAPARAALQGQPARRQARPRGAAAGGGAALHSRARRLVNRRRARQRDPAPRLGGAARSKKAAMAAALSRLVRGARTPPGRSCSPDSRFSAPTSPTR